MYGPGIVPRLPVKELGSAFSGRTISESTGSDLYRRGVYIYVRRTGPYPTVLTFDGTNRQVCSIRRIHTNTPLQALVTLNDPVFVEAAQAFARRILSRDVSATETNAEVARLTWAFEQATCRTPTPSEIAVLSELLHAERQTYGEDLGAAKRLAEEPIGPLPAGWAADEAAAWTVVANVLLNLDEVMTR